MLVSPDSTIRVANSETVTLTLDVGSSLSSVVVTTRSGDEYAFTLDVENSLEFPHLHSTPDIANVSWQDDSGDELYKTHVEVVSRQYFALDELRRYGDGQDEFEAYCEDELFIARQAATEVIEQAAHRSFVRRVGSTVDYGIDGWLYLAHNDVAELRTDGYALACDNQVRRTSGDAEFPRSIEYVYGMESVPAQISRAALVLAAYMLRPSNRPVGATGESTDAGYIHFTTAGRDGATDIPEVNAAIEQFGRGERFLW